MSHIMPDLETRGTKPGSVIISIGAVAFKPNGVVGEFMCNVTPESCLEIGLTEDESTIEFWKGQPKKLQKELAKDAAPITEALGRFTAWCHEMKIETLWGNGAAFDPVQLEIAYDKIGVEPPWTFRQVRCFRTVRKILPELMNWEREGTLHHPVDDARNQANYLLRLSHRYGLIL